MQATAPAQREDTETREDRRDRYHKLLGIVEYNTGGKQRATASIGSILTIASYCDIPARKAKRSLQAAVDNDGLLEFDGRYACTDTESLRAVLVEESNRDEGMRKALVKRCNRLLEGKR